jgi:hypothetical protein
MSAVLVAVNNQAKEAAHFSDSKDMELEAAIVCFLDGIISFVGDFTGNFRQAAALGVCNHDRHGVRQMCSSSDSGGKSF